MLTGGCMCEAVRFEVSKPLAIAEYCHCKRCQRRTGTAFSGAGVIEPGSFSLVKGEDLVKTFDPRDGGWRKSFCSVCGSQLFGTNPEDPEEICVRLGAIDGDPGVRPSFHQFVAYAAPWLTLPDDGLPRYPERMASE